jgi:hypothetical protein
MDSGGTKGKELSMSGEVSVGKGSSENSRQADRGNGKNIFRRVEMAGVVSWGLGMGSVLNIGSVGGANSKGKGNGRNIFQRAETVGADNKRDGDSEGKMGNVGEGQATMEQASIVRLRGGGNVGDDLMGEGVMATLSSCSASVGIASIKEGSGGDTGMSEGREGVSGVWLKANKNKSKSALSKGDGAQVGWSASRDGRGREPGGSKAGAGSILRAEGESGAGE